MDLFSTIAVLLTLTALLAWLNHRFIGLPMTIGVMLIALLLSLVILMLGRFGLTSVAETADRIVRSVPFDRAVLGGLLSVLLFAGAIKVDLSDLLDRRWAIASFATFGIVISTVIVALLVWLLSQAFGVPLSPLYCLIFGALISPTDPVAVLGILSRSGVGRSMQAKIAGESLFNDGVGVVLFATLLELTDQAHAPGGGDIALLFAVEVVGGLALGLAVGFIAYLLIKSVDEYKLEILLTVAVVTGGYALALALHVSAPLAIVVIGLFMGNHGRRLAMSETTRNHLDTFWELIDEVANAVLFLLIGLEVLVIAGSWATLTLALCCIPVTLLARAGGVGLPMLALRARRTFSKGAWPTLVWGGLRGGISVALALSLPAGPIRDEILILTYVVVVFSIAVQGTTIGRVAKRAAASG